MTGRPSVSVLIPTYKRANLIGRALLGLQRQNCRDFEVLIVLKPSGDGTERVLESFEEKLNIKLILQEKGCITDALNLGLEQAEGGVIAFLDDDAIPHEDWLQNHLSMYEDSSIGGVAGNVVPIQLREESIGIEGGLSELIAPRALQFDRPKKSFSRILWDRPIKGMEDYLVYISKAGIVTYNQDLSRRAWNHVTKSLLGMGTNMSLSSEALKGFKFPRSWILGVSSEQYLGWYAWGRGYSLVFNPRAVVDHIIHPDTLSRDRREAKKEVLRVAENNLLFYRLYGIECDVSGMYRATWLINNLARHLIHMCKGHELWRLAWIEGTLYSELIGLKWLVARKVGGGYYPLMDLRRLLETN